MSWEAFRLTSKSPSELFTIMGPAGVDDLVRQALHECWRSLPTDHRTFSAWQKRARETFARNRKVWATIRMPTPAAFFERLGPFASDGHLRQAMVLCWMMMPRAGGRDFRKVVRLMDGIFERNMDAWERDNRALSPHTPKAACKSATKKPSRRRRSTRT
ncbi:MAG: hypothetical protein ACREJC_03860 [Tepidisphaeraceae bacterium]